MSNQQGPLLERVFGGIMGLFKTTKSAPLCDVCRHNEIYLECDGCKTLLCLKCIKYSFYSTGCGNVHPLYFCPKCNDDKDINP